MGKTSTEIAVNQSLNYLGVKSIACLREPSLGVSMNGKGTATGALNARVLPDSINYHFNGDIHALTTTINLIAAQIDNVIYQGNELNIDPNKIVWNRAVDICDRSLRSVTVAQDDKKAIPHHCEFVITVAHELSTIMTLAADENDFIARTEKAIVAYTFDNKPIYVKDLNITGALTLLLKDAINQELQYTDIELFFIGDSNIPEFGPDYNYELIENKLILKYIKKLFSLYQELFIFKFFIIKFLTKSG